MEKLLKKENLTLILALLGVVSGIVFPEFSARTEFLGQIFLLFLKMMIIPLVFVSVFLAVARQEGGKELSRYGLGTLAYFLVTSSLACLTGLVAARLLPKADKSSFSYAAFDPSRLGDVSLSKFISGFFTGNPFRSLADGEIIQIVIFSLLLGVAAVSIEKKKRDQVIGFFDGIHDMVMVIIGWILYVAPVGVFSLVASVVAHTEASAFAGLGWFFVATGMAALVHCLLTLPAIGLFLGGFHPYRFIFNVREALIVALATASSSATLPVSTRVLEEREGVKEKTTGFVLPLGATLNMDGSALYQALVVLFLGNLAGADFSLTQQLMIFLFVMLSSAGTAGIPGGGLVMMGAMLQMVGVPLELIGIYLLVDRFWDPIITAVNVMGDLFGAKVIDRRIS